MVSPHFGQLKRLKGREGVFDVPSDDLYLLNSVPLIVVAPSKYLRGKHLDVNRWASHADIFPTVFNLALPQTPYLHLGNNLLATDSLSYAITEGRYILTKDGGLDLQTGLNYKWMGGGHLKSTAESTVPNLTVEKAKATITLRNYLQLQNAQ